MKETTPGCRCDQQKIMKNSGEKRFFLVNSVTASNDDSNPKPFLGFFPSFSVACGNVIRSFNDLVATRRDCCTIFEWPSEE